jgi:hypothetical protein
VKTLMGTGTTGLSHTAHLVIVCVIAGVLLALLWRAVSGRRVVVQAPPPPASGHGLRNLMLAAAGILAAGWAYGRAHHPAAAAAAPPQARVVTRTITQTITRYVHTHPQLSGTDIVWLGLIAAVAVLGALSLARRPS